MSARTRKAGSRGSAEPARGRAAAKEVLDGGIEGALEVDRLIHQPVRLALVSALAVSDRMSFNELKRVLDVSDGNLSVHARKLEDGGYVACDKTFAGRVPRTDYRLTDAGRTALDRYLEHMDALIRAVRAG